MLLVIKMDVMFKKCSEAINYAEKTGMFGCFYSDKHDANTNIHIHNCCEILLCLRGGKNFFIRDRIYNVNKGDVFILNEFENHKITFEENEIFERFVLQISPEFLNKVSTPLTDLSQCFYVRNQKISHKISTTPQQCEILVGLFKKLENSVCYADEIIKELAVTEILVNINRMFFESNTDYTYSVSYDNQSIIKALKFINDNYDKPLTLEAVAKNTFISTNKLCALFKEHLGTTVKKYITSRRITKAKNLLNKGHSVSEAATLCGFDDYANFIRVFGKATGMSPGKYKKLNAAASGDKFTEAAKIHKAQ